MSVRYYCDMCGKEIIDTADKYTLSVTTEDINSINLVNTHICKNCVEKLEELIKTAHYPQRKEI